MAQVGWIKLSTDIFSNRKIKILLKEREGDTYLRIWVQILTIAGECNRDGGLYISDKTPFKIKDFTNIIGKSNKTLTKSLQKFVNLGMLILKDDTFFVKNWSKYQSADKYLKALEQNRERQRKFRENHKDDNNVNVTLGNDTEDNIKENNKIEKSKREFSKTLPYMNYEQRKYSDEFWEQLIDNNKK